MTKSQSHIFKYTMRYAYDRISMKNHLCTIFIFYYMYVPSSIKLKVICVCILLTFANIENRYNNRYLFLIFLTEKNNSRY